MGILGDILKPGSSEALVPFVRYVIYAILAVCAFCFYSDIGRLHMVVLSVLAVGLLFSINYFERIIGDLKEDASANEETEDKKTS